RRNAQFLGLIRSRPSQSPDKSGVMGELCRIIRHLESGIVSTYADNLSKAGWSWGCVSAIDSEGRTILIADAHRALSNRPCFHSRHLGMVRGMWRRYLPCSLSF